MSPRRSRVPLMICIISLGTFLLARSSEGATAPGKIFVQEIVGHVQGSSLQIAITTGPIVTKAMRVYSEPSHTLLVYLLDSEFSRTGEAKSWITSCIGPKPNAPSLTTDLPNASPAIQVGARPSEDDRIAIWINGLWPHVGERDVLIADGKVGNGDFHFTTSIPKELVAGATPDDPTNCCTGTCGTGCIDCPGPRFTCCLIPSCACHGYDNDHMFCGFIQCDLCL